MADRYQDRPFAADARRRGGDPYGADRGESDPLAELARLIGQTDPFGSAGRNAPPRAAAPRVQPREPYAPPPEPEGEVPDPAGPPTWVQRANYRREVPPEVPRESLQEPAPREVEQHPSPVHPLHRYAAPPHQAQPNPYSLDEPPDAEPEAEGDLDPSRYDEALYGRIETGAPDYQREPAFPDDAYAYQSEDDEEVEEPNEKRGGGFVKVVAVLGLAVVGLGAAWAYRSYVTSTRSGEPPIIHADNSPTKIVPAPSDGSAKVPDRLASGDGTEKIVPREEAPLDVDTHAAGPRVVFPPLNQNSNPPAAASTPGTPSATGAAAAPNNGTLPNSEPRKIRTFSVRGDEPDAANTAPANAPPAPPAAANPAPAPRSLASRRSPASANASANAPLSLSPQAQSAPAAETRVASTNPTQTTAPSGGGSFLVQLSSQRNEADAQASFKALQGKFPDLLGSQTPVIKRADLGDKGIHYRALVGPFGTHEEAAQFCSNFISAGGQCFVPKN